MSVSTDYRVRSLTKEPEVQTNKSTQTSLPKIKNIEVLIGVECLKKTGRAISNKSKKCCHSCCCSCKKEASNPVQKQKQQVVKIDVPVWNGQKVQTKKQEAEPPKIPKNVNVTVKAEALSPKPAVQNAVRAANPQAGEIPPQKIADQKPAIARKEEAPPAKIVNQETQQAAPALVPQSIIQPQPVNPAIETAQKQEELPQKIEDELAIPAQQINLPQQEKPEIVLIYDSSNEKDVQRVQENLQEKLKEKATVIHKIAIETYVLALPQKKAYLAFNFISNPNTKDRSNLIEIQAGIHDNTRNNCVMVALDRLSRNKIPSYPNVKSGFTTSAQKFEERRIDIACPLDVRRDLLSAERVPSISEKLIKFFDEYVKSRSEAN